MKLQKCQIGQYGRLVISVKLFRMANMTKNTKINEKGKVGKNANYDQEGENGQ